VGKHSAAFRVFSYLRLPSPPNERLLVFTRICVPPPLSLSLSLSLCLCLCLSVSLSLSLRPQYASQPADLSVHVMTHSDEPLDISRASALRSKAHGGVSDSDFIGGTRYCVKRAAVSQYRSPNNADLAVRLCAVRLAVLGTSRANRCPGGHTSGGLGGQERVQRRPFRVVQGPRYSRAEPISRPAEIGRWR